MFGQDLSVGHTFAAAREVVSSFFDVSIRCAVWRREAGQRSVAFIKTKTTGFSSVGALARARGVLIPKALEASSCGWFWSHSRIDPSDPYAALFREFKLLRAFQPHRSPLIARVSWTNVFDLYRCVVRGQS